MPQEEALNIIRLLKKWEKNALSANSDFSKKDVESRRVAFSATY